MKTKRNILILLAIFACVSISMAQLPSYVPTNGLVAYWPFNGNANDASGNGNDGTVLGGTTLTSDRFNITNSSYEVDGVNCPDAKGVSLPASINNSESYSISVWFQTLDSSKIDQTIINSYPHQYISVNFNYPYSGFANKTCSFFGNGTWQVYGNTIYWNTYDLNSWHNIIVVKETATIEYYQDGILVFTQATLPSYNSGNFSSLVAGAISINGGSQCYETFKGKIDDIGIWNRALTQQEITSLFTASDTDQTLIAHYPFNGNANDESGNGNDGIINGTITPTTDRFGNTNSAYLFDGQTGYIDVPSLDSMPYTPVTYSAWVIVDSYFPTPTPGHKFRTVLGRQTAYVLDCGAMGFYANGLVDGGAYDNNFTWWRGGGQTGDAPYSDSIPLLNTWTHIAFTQEASGNWTWYTNGVLTNSGNFTDPQNYYDYFRIGGSNNNSEGNTLWNDKLDDITIWNRAITASEIDSLYHVGGWDSDTSLVAHYPFNGNADDESGSENDGTVLGAELTTDRFGNQNQAYEFNGTSDYISMSSMFNIPMANNPRSISVWMNPSQPWNQWTLTSIAWGSPSTSNAYMFGLGQDLIAVQGWADDISAPLVYSTNEWINAVCTYDGNNVDIYVDGVLVGSGVNTTWNTTGNEFLIGSRVSLGNGYFPGKLDDICVWDRVITTSEIDSLYHVGGWDSDTSLVAHYPFNGNANDESGNGNDGTVNGATLTNDRFGNDNSAYNFDGNNDIIDVYGITDVSGNWSASFWFNSLNNASFENQNIVGFGPSLASYGGPGFSINGGIAPGQCPVFNSYPDKMYMTDALQECGQLLFSDNYLNDTWYNITILNSDGDYSVYINGNYDINGLLNNIVPSQLHFGNRADMVFQYFSGKIDDVSLWNRVITTSEIDSLYHVGGWDDIVCDFSGSPVNGTSPLNVSFSDLSTGNPTIWKWDFDNDGTFDSFSQNPTHTYNSPGIYSVKLVIEDGTQTDSLIKVDYINVTNSGNISADFVADITSGITPLVVNFTDLSTGSPTTWKWDFENDGVFDSYIQFPSHNYTNSGSYSVKLVIENNSLTDTLIKYNYINVSPPSTGTDLIAFYPFNGNADDESGNGNNGAVMGATLTNDRYGNENSAYSFDGINDYIFSSIGDSDTLAVSFWYKASTPDKYYPSFFSYDGTGFFGQYGGTLNPPYIPGDVICFPANYGLQSLPIPAFNEWHHVYMDIDNVGHTQKVYVDGNYDNTYTGVSSITTGDDFNIGVGDPNGTPSQYFTGNLDDFKIYGRRLNSQEILDLYNQSNVQTPEICIVTVDDQIGYNLVVWEKQVTTEIDSFNVYRETTQANEFELIGTVSYIDAGIYIDENSVPVQRAYKYKLSAIDNNGNETPLSNYHKTIHLSYSTGPQGMNLAWDQYEGFEFGSYYIYKSTTPDNFILIDSISSSFTSYTDIYPPWGNVYYTIEIVNPNGCLPSRDDYSRSRSNVVFNPLVSTLENSADFIHLYPNPTSSKIYIEVGEAWNSSDLIIEVLDLHGRVIQHNKYSNSKPEIELLSIKPGIYLLSVSDGTSKVVRKVIKK